MVPAGACLVARGREQLGIGLPLVLAAAVPLLASALAVEVWTHWSSGLHPDEHSYGAIVAMVSVVQAQCVAAAATMALFTVARHLTGKLTSVRRVTLDNTALFWHYTVAQGLVALLLVHLFPRLLGAD